MQMIFSLMAMIFLFATDVFGCMPPPAGTPRSHIQRSWINQVVTDQTLWDKVLELGGVSGAITTIETSANFDFEVTMNNGCTFKMAHDYSDASPGQCPVLLPLKVVNEHCP